MERIIILQHFSLSCLAFYGMQNTSIFNSPNPSDPVYSVLSETDYLPSDSHILNFHLKLVVMCTFMLLILDLVNFQRRDSMLVNIAFHSPCDISLIRWICILQYFLAALFILITQADLVYHQQLD